MLLLAFEYLTPHFLQIVSSIVKQQQQQQKFAKVSEELFSSLSMSRQEVRETNMNSKVTDVENMPDEEELCFLALDVLH